MTSGPHSGAPASSEPLGATVDELSLWLCAACGHGIDEHLVIRPTEPEEPAPCTASTPIGRCGCTSALAGGEPLVAYRKP